MKVADMELGKVYAATGHRDWSWDRYLSANKVTLLDKRTWYDDSSGMYYRKAEVKKVTPEFGGPVTVNSNIGTLKRQYCKRGVLVRVEAGWAVGNVRVIPFQQVVATWEDYVKVVDDNAARQEKARLAQAAQSIKDDADRETMSTYVELLGLKVTIPHYGKPYVKLYIDDLTTLVNESGRRTV